MTERIKPVGLRVSTIYRLRQLQVAGESLDAVVRRLCGVPAVVRPVAPVAAPAPRGTTGRPRASRYEQLRNAGMFEIVNVPWELDERGQIVPGQPALIAALRYIARTTKRQFVEEPGSGQGTRWMRTA